MLLNKLIAGIRYVTRAQGLYSRWDMEEFFTRYPESNWMHKRMQALSLRVARLPKGKCTEDLLDDLYEAQANDACWHGLFGGLYLPHLRRAVYKAIIRLEAKLDNIAPRQTVPLEDFDKDGSDELFLFNKNNAGYS